MGVIWTGIEDWREHLRKSKQLGRDPVPGIYSDWNTWFVMESTRGKYGEAGSGKT